MRTEEIMIYAVCALVGYWVISAVIGSKTKPPADAANAPDEPDKPAQPKGPLAWHEVLGVSKNASLEDIQAAYRTLVSQYHPDKVASLGAELQELAEAKSRAINRAYSDALAEVGSRL